MSAGIGTVTLKAEAPAILSDPSSDCFAALRMLLLEKHVRGADPIALQVGRLWGLAAKGMELPRVARASSGWLLNKHRVRGGRRPDDLAQSLDTILTDRPDADVSYVCRFLMSDKAADLYHRTGRPPTIHVTNVEVDEITGAITFDSRTGKRGEITRASLNRAINRARARLAGANKKDR